MSESERFCDLLSQMLKDSAEMKIAFYTGLGIKEPYFYDIISGKVNPLPPEKQFVIIKILKPNLDTCKKFY